MHHRLQAVLYYFAFCILISISFTACVYENDEDNNFTLVDPTPKVSEITIKLNPEEDTVEIFGPVNFTFEIENMNDVYMIQTDIGVNHYLNDDGFSGGVNYTPQIDSGFVKLTLKALARTHTGSLADQLYQEFVRFEKSWVVKVYTKPPRPVIITSVAPYNGSLKISWTKSTQPNFYSYEVSRIVGGDFRNLTVIFDAETNSFVDEEVVVGDSAVYTITTTKGTDTKASTHVTYRPARPVAPVQAVRKDNKFKLVWSSSELYNNVAKYEVYRGTDSLRTYELVYTTTNPKDTSYEISADFGLRTFFSIITYSKGERIRRIPSNSLGYRLGQEIPAYEQIFFSSSKDIYLTYANSTLTSYKESSNERLLQITAPSGVVSLVMSNDGTRLYVLTNTDLYWYDIETLTTHQQDISSFRGNEYYAGVGEAPDGKVLLCKSAFGGYGTLQFYDPEARTVVEEYTNMPSSPILQLSSDGAYVLGHGGPDRILRLNADHTVEYVYMEYGKIYFDPSEAGNVIVSSEALGTNGSVRIRELSSGDLLQVLPTPEINVFDIDVETSRVVGSVVGGMVVYDYKNGRELERFGPATRNLSLHGDYVYSSDGARLKVNP